MKKKNWKLCPFAGNTLEACGKEEAVVKTQNWQH